MKGFFKISKENTDYHLPTKIPDDFFNDNTHCHISTTSRLSPSFDQMLNLSPARQMFLRYLRVERLQGIYFCYRDLKTRNYCGQDCLFTTENNPGNVRKLVQRMLELLTSSCNETDLSGVREKVDTEMTTWRKNENVSCVLLSIYSKYFSSLASAESSFDCHQWSQCFKESNILYRFLGELFQKSHEKPLSTVLELEQLIYNYLCNTLFQTYLKSNMHRQYQLQLLNAGLNSLQLSDFIYSEEYLMILTEFCEMKGLNNFLAFLLTIITLASTSDKCSFNDALEVYSRFFVMGGVHFIELPSSVTNYIINQMCQYNSNDCSPSSDNINPTIIFDCAFKPIYLFLEQYWLPEFLVCQTYQRSLKQLCRIIQENQTRRRNNSEISYNIPVLSMSDSQSIDDCKSDLSADNHSVQSEPAISHSLPVDNHTKLNSNNHTWWPSKRLENRLPRRFPRPMSLGSFDDLGRYQPVMNSKRQSNIPNSTSSEILTTISELGSDLWSKLYTGSNETRTGQPPADEIARQIISDVQIMTLGNQ